MTRSDQPGGLIRRLGTGDAVAVGLSAMIGAGVFVAFAPAAAAAGALLLVGLLVAAVVAYCNATSSAQLAAQYPTSGGTYAYGRARLGEWWGFAAGWGFVVGKTASCAAMALTFAAYAVPEPWQRPAALVAVLTLATVNYRGIERTARVARTVVALVLAFLVAFVLAGVVGLASGESDLQQAVPRLGEGVGWYGVLQAAGLLFFAFAGYARIATLGEEVRDPTRTIPRAVQVSLGVTVVTYAAVGVTLLAVLGPEGTAAATAPLAAALEATPWAWLAPFARVAAALAALGALLALLAGVGRTTLAMAREGDLPRWLAGVHPVHRVPHHAEVALAAVIGVLVLTADLRAVIGFSSFGVLVYYLVANLAALTQDTDHRRFPRPLQVLGAVGCAVLVVTLPPASVAVGVMVLAVGAGYRVVRLSRGA